ncbi:hypothetical protein KR222_003858, partial [Zaprionus bogoriensis]
PRLLWFKHNDNNKQQPLIIYQQPAERHHHHRPHWDDYYDDYPPRRPHPPPSPQNPGLNVIVINPINSMNISSALNHLNTTNVTPATARSAGNDRAAISILNLLQSLNTQSVVLADDSDLGNPAEAEAEATGPAAAAEPPANYGDEYDRDEDFAEEELALLERQAARGLSPRHLLSLLVQDKRRRRIQEAVAGIYLRNYNLNRK